MTDARSPAELAASIGAARDRLVEFVLSCPDDDWHGRPLTSDGDRRAVGVIADHVANAFEYIGSWIRQLVAGDNPHVDVALVDKLNAMHAPQAARLTQEQVVRHLHRSGNKIMGLIAGLDEADLDAGGGRIRRFAEISARHPDSHRAALQAALADPSWSAHPAAGQAPDSGSNL